MASKDFTKKLFRWYKARKRHLPWRKTTDPYRILVSEVMLQQTQAGRVVPKYREFVRRFPTLESLARAKPNEALRVWSGLGYNRRAIYLRKAAEIIHRDYHGRFPKDVATLRKLPGIGPASAAAIACYAFGMAIPPVDVNVFRVSKRHLFPSAKAPQEIAQLLVDRNLIPKSKARDFFWAMLDIGAKVCTARECTPACPFHPPLINARIGSARQGRFIGSQRFFRGQILKILTRSKKVISSSSIRTKIQETYNGKLPRLEPLLKQMAREGLVRIISRRPLHVKL